VSGIKPGGTDQVIIKNAGAIAGTNGGLPAEGSQVYKVNGKYYIFLITWPRGGMRTELVFRSDNLTGPYEGRVALKDRGIAQGGIFDTPDGRWYAMLFRDSGAVGRIPYLVPVKWADGWPVFGTDGKAPDVLDLPAPAGDIPGIVASDEFDRAPGARPLPLVWQWNHNPVNEDWSLSERPGFLRIKTGRVTKGLLDTPNTLTQRTFGPQCSAAVALDVTHMKDGDVAGLAALQKNYGFVGVKMSAGAKSIVMVNAGSGTPAEVARVPLSQPTVHLKIGMDFRDRADQARFSYSPDGKQWHAIGDVLKMRYTIPHFMGYRFALFHYATETTGGVVDFDYFRIGDKSDAPNPG
jgi:beta-xylosidase